MQIFPLFFIAMSAMVNTCFAAPGSAIVAGGPPRNDKDNMWACTETGFNGDCGKLSARLGHCGEVPNKHPAHRAKSFLIPDGEGWNCYIFPEGTSGCRETDKLKKCSIHDRRDDPGCGAGPWHGYYCLHRCATPHCVQEIEMIEGEGRNDTEVGV